MSSASIDNGAGAERSYPAGVKRPRQQRSNETYERILDRVETLLDGRDFETVTILEILEAAEVSASSLYARFGDKEALLRALHVRHFERVRTLAEAIAAHDGWDEQTLEEVCENQIRIAVAHRRNNAARILTFRQAESRYPDFEARRHRMDLFMLKSAGDYFERRLAEVGRPFDRRDFALSCYLMVCSIEAAASAPDGLGSFGQEPDDEWLVQSLTRMMSRFLDVVNVPAIESPKASE